MRYLLCLLAGLPLLATAQHQPKCFTDELHSNIHRFNTLTTDQRVEKEIELKNYIEKVYRPKKMADEVITIPVVFHILYNNENQNLSDDFVHSQMEVLNEDFNRINFDTLNTPDDFKGIAAPAGIEFCLATRDPEGNPTNGITRTETEKSSFSFGNDFAAVSEMCFDETGGKTSWGRDDYLNVWVCNLSDTEGVLGFAYFPGADERVDGIVCDFEFFGRPSLENNTYNLGRTMTHEVGHWLNLWHTFNFAGEVDCSEDFVEDTPGQSSNTFGCPNYPSLSCSAQSDMFMNFMDYADDSCSNMFTLGQVERMKAALHLYRRSLLSSRGCQPLFENDAKIARLQTPVQHNCQAGFLPFILDIRNIGTTDLTSLNIVYAVDDGDFRTYEWNGALAPGAENPVFVTTLNATEGMMQLRYFIEKPNGEDLSIFTDTLSYHFSTEWGAPLPFVEDFSENHLQKGWSTNDLAGAVPWLHIQEIWGSNDSINAVMGVFNEFHDFFDVTGTTDELTSPLIDLSESQESTLSFDYSFAYLSNIEDSLFVEVSTDCDLVNGTFTRIFAGGGTAFSTRSGATPERGEDWQNLEIDLSDYDGQKVIVKLVNYSEGGAYIMIDNFTVDGMNVATSVSKLEDRSAIHLVPNPGSDHFKIISEKDISEIAIFNALGQKVHSEKESTTIMNTSGLSAGVYFIQIKDDQGYQFLHRWVKM